MLWFQKQFEQQKVPLLLPQTSPANVSPKVLGKGSHALMCVYAHRFMHMYVRLYVCMCMHIHVQISMCVSVLYGKPDAWWSHILRHLSAGSLEEFQQLPEMASSLRAGSVIAQPE